MYSLDARIVSDIVGTIAEKLELPTMGIEEEEVLTEVVALSIALYMQKLCPKEDDGMIQ